MQQIKMHCCSNGAKLLYFCRFLLRQSSRGPCSPSKTFFYVMKCLQKSAKGSDFSGRVLQYPAYIIFNKGIYICLFSPPLSPPILGTPFVFTFPLCPKNQSHWFLPGLYPPIREELPGKVLCSRVD